MRDCNTGIPGIMAHTNHCRFETQKGFACCEPFGCRDIGVGGGEIEPADCVFAKAFARFKMWRRMHVRVKKDAGLLAQCSKEDKTRAGDVFCGIAL